jgi:collagen beta-1,O-galactosyltransferase
LKAFVVNLKRRPDRRARMQSIMPPGLDVEYTTDWSGPLDGETIDEALAGYGLFSPWQIESDNQFWRRRLKKGEIGCAVSHWLCWKRSLVLDGQSFLYLEDDVVFVDGFMEKLRSGIARLSEFDGDWDLLYLGRHPQAPDAETEIDGIVRPGYSHCSFAYVLSRGGVAKLLATGYDRAIIPVDEFLPALYLDHPRLDVRERYPKVLSAYAFEPALVTDLPRDIWGTDTEESDYIED